jgi:hypothetical protein
MSLRLRLYVLATVLVAGALLVIGFPRAFAVDWGHYVAWVVICLVSETMWSNTISGAATWSLSATAGLSSAVLWGPGAGLWISALSTLIADLSCPATAVRVACLPGRVATGWASVQWLGRGVALPLATGGGI